MAEILTRTIVWRRNSPYGTYNSGDKVYIYYDNVAKTIVVKRNGSTITSGGSIPLYFYNASYSAAEHKTETEINVVICDGTTRVQLERTISAFPYVEKKLYSNSQSCAVAPVVCDLTFNSLPIIGNESTAGALDGSVTVSATSSNSPIEYNLGADFIYGSGQSSGTFTGLTAGTYWVYARDAGNCQDSMAVLVGLDKTYSSIYELEYEDRLGNLTKIEILERDYTGATTEITGGEVPVIARLRGEGEDDKFVPIIGSEIELSLVSVTNYQFQNLFTSDPNKYRVTYSKDFGSGFELLLTTKLLPNQYKEAYTEPPYGVAFLATDGLALLKDIPFTDRSGNRLQGSYKSIELIAFCLRNTGLNLNIRVAISLYAEGMDDDPTTSDDPLDQAYVDTDAYYFNDTPSCLDILRYILEPFDAQVVQWGNVWNIMRVEQRVDEFDYREFDDLGAYISNGTFDPVLTSQSSTQEDLIWQSDPTMEINNAYGLIQLNYTLGLRENLLKNGDFKLKSQPSFFSPTGWITSPDIRGFQLVANGDDGVNLTYQIVDQDKVKSYPDYKGIISDKDNVAVTIGSAFGNAYLLSKDYDIVLGASDQIKFTIRCGVPNYTIHIPPYVKVRCVIRYGSFYLTGAGNWVEIYTEIVYFITEFGKFIEFSTTPESVPDGADAGLTFNIKVFHAYSYYADVNSVANQRAVPTGPPGTINAGSFVAGHSYTITSVGSTNFTAIGAVSNTVGVTFTATGTGSGTGTANAIYLGLGHKLTRVDSSVFRFYYYELEENTSSESVPDRVRPTDYNAITNPVQWILKTMRYQPGNSEAFNIDKLSVGYFFNGSAPPTVNDSSIEGETNNQYSLKKSVIHGSIIESVITTTGVIPIFNFTFDNLVFELQPVEVEVQNKELSYCGYFRDSTGVGFDKWSRSYISESLKLHEISLRSLASQYNTPWRRLRGSLTGENFVTPISTILETHDSKKYYPIALEIDDKNRMFSGEYVELTDVVTGGGDDPDTSAGFSLGFSIGFNS